MLGRAAEDCDSVMAVGDEYGQLLWVCGRPGVLRRAESIKFVEGAQWDEAHAGTNAPGTALRLDAPVTIQAAEHFVRPVQRWSCAAAPIHDPATHAILGVVDVTGGETSARRRRSPWSGPPPGWPSPSWRPDGVRRSRSVAGAGTGAGAGWRPGGVSPAAARSACTCAAWADPTAW